MSFKRLTPSDFLVSADSITSPCWTNNTYDLSSFFTSSAQAASSQGDYVLAVYQTSSVLDEAAIQFYLDMLMLQVQDQHHMILLFLNILLLLLSMVNGEI
jgi:TRAP-type C4-dicarboxylate transport system permease large subunit